jgi:hypothetical protein
VLTSCHYRLYERQMLNSPRVHLTLDVMLRDHASTSSGMELHVHCKHGGDKMTMQINDTHVCTHQLPPRTRCPAACQQAAPVQRNRGSLAQLAQPITHQTTCRIRANLSMQHVHRQPCTVHLSDVPPWLPAPYAACQAGKCACSCRHAPSTSRAVLAASTMLLKRTTKQQ